MAGIPALILSAETIPVRYVEGSKRGFLALRNLDGTTIASGELRQSVRGSRVTARVIFRFKDGSLDDETTVYDQRSTIRLVSDHLIQRGPSFPHPLDIAVDVATGTVTDRSQKDGKLQVESQHVDLPTDLSNGLMLTLVTNLRADSGERKVSMLLGSKPRMITLAISPEAQETYTIAGLSHKAQRYVAKIQLGGITGAVAPLIGKAPADIHIWVADGAPPTLLKAEGQLFEGGPVWRIELANPEFSGQLESRASR